MTSCKTYTPKTHWGSGLEDYFRRIFELHPQVDEHEFATAYVNHVDETGQTPSVWYAMESFVKTGKVA